MKTEYEFSPAYYNNTRQLNVDHSIVSQIQLLGIPVNIQPSKHYTRVSTMHRINQWLLVIFFVGCKLVFGYSGNLVDWK